MSLGKSPTTLSVLGYNMELVEYRRVNVKKAKSGLHDYMSIAMSR